MRVLVAKTITVFVVMFSVSLYMSGLLLVDYSDYIADKRYQIGILSKLVNYDIVQPLESKITILGERGCRQEWDALKKESSDFSDLIAIGCLLLFCVFVFRRVWVSKTRPFMRVDCRHLNMGRFYVGKVCCYMVMVYMVAYAVMYSIFRLLSSFLMWPMLSSTKVDVSTYCRQLLLAWNQLLTCDMWLNIVYCVFGLFSVLVIVVWLFTNIRYVKATPTHTPCP